MTTFNNNRQTTSRGLDRSVIQVRRLRIGTDSPDWTRFLFAWWDSNRGANIGPPASTVTPDNIGTHYEKITLIDVRANPPDYVYAHSNKSFSAIHGADLTGLSIYDLEPRFFVEYLTEELSTLVRTAEPQFVHLSFVNRLGRDRSYSVLRLPLSQKGEKVDMILTATDTTSLGDLKDFFDDAYGRR